jgi:CrcB protein
VSASGWIAFLVAAGLGATARYLVDGAVEDRTGGLFPWGTLVVNVSGCLALGLLTGLGLYHGLDGRLITALGTGGLGAYTTFSTCTFETVGLAARGATSLAVRNALGNLLFGLVAAGAGLAIAATV